MYKKKPEWLRIKIQNNENRRKVEDILKRMTLHTVCEEALCPNLMECFCNKTATFMILGKTCTRNCTFCNIGKGKPEPVDNNEPLNVALAVKELNLKYAVITSVTRDDLIDGGASHFADTIYKIKEINKDVKIEVLIPDFQGNPDSLKTVINAKPDVVNHNIETVPYLYGEVRPKAVYSRSIELIANIKKTDKKIFSKSGIMVGFGEKQNEVINVLKDLRNADCDFLTIGQYLSPSKKNYEVVEYIHPDIFEYYKKTALDLGFKFAASAPFVRSSYNAGINASAQLAGM